MTTSMNVIWVSTTVRNPEEPASIMKDHSPVQVKEVHYGVTFSTLYHLECKEGFYGEDGFTCKDIDECACADDNCPEVNKVF